MVPSATDGGDLCRADAGLEAESNGGAGLGFEDIPALGLAASLSGGLGLRVVGMDLHRELVVGKENLDQQRKLAADLCRRCLPASFRLNGPVSTIALRPGQPRLADQLCRFRSIRTTAADRSCPTRAR